MAAARSWRAKGNSVSCRDFARLRTLKLFDPGPNAWNGLRVDKKAAGLLCIVVIK